MIVTLGGGVGGSKFLKGVSLAAEEEITAIINTGDDIERFGLYISPDIDINLYVLADVIHEQGWGYREDTYAAQSILSSVYGEDCWFNLGDKDLATHIYRTFLMKQNKKLSEVTAEMTRKFQISVRMLPMSDERVVTYIDTPKGRMNLQEYLIKERAAIPVQAIEYEGVREARPAPGVLSAIEQADMILIAPSNPYVSIFPILEVPGIREAIRRSRAKVAAVSPIVGGHALKGPLAHMMEALGAELSPRGIAACYGDLIDAIVIDVQDEHYRGILEQSGLQVLVTDTVMKSADKKRDLAKAVIDFVKGGLSSIAL